MKTTIRFNGAVIKTMNSKRAITHAVICVWSAEALAETESIGWKRGGVKVGEVVVVSTTVAGIAGAEKALADWIKLSRISAKHSHIVTV